MSEEINSIPELEKEFLKKMMGDCSKETAKAMSEMINKTVELDPPLLKFSLINNVPKMLNPNDLATALFFTKISGNIPGVIVISSTVNSFLKLADIFLHKPMGHFKDLSDENVSVIREFANIMIGYYITALNKELNMEYYPPSPTLSINPHRAIEDFGFGLIYREKIDVLTLAVRLRIDEEDIKSDILLIFNKNSTKRILEKLMMSKLSMISKMQK